MSKLTPHVFIGLATALAAIGCNEPTDPAAPAAEAQAERAREWMATEQRLANQPPAPPSVDTALAAALARHDVATAEAAAAAGDDPAAVLAPDPAPPAAAPEPPRREVVVAIPRDLDGDELAAYLRRNRLTVLHRHGDLVRLRAADGDELGAVQARLADDGLVSPAAEAAR